MFSREKANALIRAHHEVINKWPHLEVTLQARVEKIERARDFYASLNA